LHRPPPPRAALPAARQQEAKQAAFAGAAAHCFQAAADRFSPLAGGNGGGASKIYNKSLKRRNKD